MASTGTLPPGLDDAELIAHGGFASVYRAWQPDFHRRVAVKVLNADAGDPEVRGRFEREVRAMGAVSDHPNVVPVYDAGVAGDRPYLVMPYMAGGSLADDLRPMAPEDVIRVGIAVADALDAAHGNGLLHRDVKPANILCTERGEPKLADFGVARFADATATQGQLALTLAYAAPELLRGERATVASDVYSLGATLHALLRGEQPFPVPADTAPMAMAMRIVNDDAPDLRTTGVPSRLAAVIEQAMAKDPAERHASAAMLRDALEAASTDDADTEDETVVAAPTLIAGQWDEPEPRTMAVPPVATPSGPRRTGAPWWPFALVALVVAAVLVAALVAATDDGEDDGDGDLANVTSTTAADPPPSTEAAPTTAPPSTETSEPASTDTTAAPTDDSDADAVDAARDYFAVLDGGDIEGGWRRLSSSYQNESGRSSYFGFWETIDSVEVLEAGAGPDDLTATVTVRYTRTDGTSTTETNTLRFVAGEEGRLFIDGSS